MFIWLWLLVMVLVMLGRSSGVGGFRVWGVGFKPVAGLASIGSRGGGCYWRIAGLLVRWLAGSTQQILAPGTGEKG